MAAWFDSIVDALTFFFAEHGLEAIGLVAGLEAVFCIWAMLYGRQK